MKNKLNLKIIIPIVIIIIICTSLIIGMNHHDKQEQSTTKIVYMNREIPTFNSLDPIINAVITNNDLKNKVSMLTFLGSWCVACTVELPFLKNHVSQKIPIYGVDFDEQSKTDIIRWLKIHHSTKVFQKISYDNHDKLAIDLGVTGAPESFIINKKGEIVLHIIGIINNKLWQSTILNLINELKKED